MEEVLDLDDDDHQSVKRALDDRALPASAEPMLRALEATRRTEVLDLFDRTKAWYASTGETVRNPPGLLRRCIEGRIAPPTSVDASAARAGAGVPVEGPVRRCRDLLGRAERARLIEPGPDLVAELIELLPALEEALGEATAAGDDALTSSLCDELRQLTLIRERSAELADEQVPTHHQPRRRNP
jgi:hypothetical protein